jgi:hypothetical protein
LRSVTVIVTEFAANAGFTEVCAGNSSFKAVSNGFDDSRRFGCALHCADSAVARGLVLALHS